MKPSTKPPTPLRVWPALALAAALMAGCATSGRAPVEDRRAPAAKSAPMPIPVVEVPAPAAKPVAGAENAGKPGYYTVKRGDTLLRIALDAGQNWRDISRWNGLEDPNRIEVDQVLRVLPPTADGAAVTAASRPVAPAGRVDSKALEPKTSTAALPAASAAAGAASVPPVATAPAPGLAAREGDDAIDWIWPANGALRAGFDGNTSKGLAITGKAGDPVLAAADGRVVYAGAGLPGYGNLVIVKHNATYLTAYAHNQSLLVKEDQAVRRGQKIAEMGSSDADRVQLHFEIRRLGKAIDPARLLPPR